MKKSFRLSSTKIKPIAKGYGSCLASDQITVEGKPVGYMYRENGDNPTDSGWRFFSGEETQEFADIPANFELYDVNTIANYDSAIIPYLDKPPEMAWLRNTNGKFEPETLKKS